jgi:hypothetical protein
METPADAGPPAVASAAGAMLHAGDAVMDREALQMTLPNGTSVWFGVREEGYPSLRDVQATSEREREASIGAIAELLARIESEHDEQLHRQHMAKLLSENAAAATSAASAAAAQNVPADSATTAAAPATSSSASGTLWVDKYAPTRFTDLLVEGYVARDVTAWLQQWARYTRGEGQPPENRALLLVGGPGRGKTSMSHVTAVHCGFSVMEINASADRSDSLLRYARARPVCVCVWVLTLKA